MLKTPSGIHGEHSEMYIRNVQITKDDDLGNFLKAQNPEMFEESVWSQGKTDYVVSFPIQNTSEYIYKDDLLGVELLKKVKLVQKYWVEESTNIELCTHPKIRHNVSNTINVINWDETRDYIYKNREWFAGISLLNLSGDKDYNQAPFTSIKTPSKILELYGEASIFASGLIVDGMHCFNNNLWEACDSVLFDSPFDENSDTAMKKDWVRRFKKFANNYFNGDLKKTSYLLKDVHLYHKWNKITSNLKKVDWKNSNIKPTFTSISTMGAMACSGGSCEII